MSPVNVLVIGSGGREHAIVWKLSQSTQVDKIYIAPGSYGTAQLTKVQLVDLNIQNFEVK